LLKRQAKIVGSIRFIVDLSAVLAAFLVAYRLRASQVALHEITHYSWILIVVIPVWYVLMTRFGVYASLRTRSYSHLILALVKVHFLGSLILTTAIYFVESKGFSRGMAAYFIAFSFLFLTAARCSLKAGLGMVRRRGYNCRHIVVVGFNSKAREFLRVIEEHAWWGLRVAGLVAAPNEETAASPEGYTRLGSVDNLSRICRMTPVDEVVFCLSKELLPMAEEYFADMEEMGITIRMVLDQYNPSNLKGELDFFPGKMPILTVYTRELEPGAMFVKRCLDVVGASIGLIFMLSILPFVACGIRIDSPGPIFFGQERVGKHGRRFKCWKFRSMHVDAEARKKELQQLNELNGAVFKIANDPRVTRFGRFLRKTSIDELPQFWNVLRGEMSLVGTRPPTVDELEFYDNWHMKRISIKPGITGLWQVSGRNRIKDFDEIVKLDIRYIENWSLGLDLRILLRTVFEVLSLRGAH
jgi:exopolysaccharide biosynthesis polyprenyl glycosylphosphotransferase